MWYPEEAPLSSPASHQSELAQSLSLLVWQLLTRLSWQSLGQFWSTFLIIFEMIILSINYIQELSYSTDCFTFSFFVYIFSWLFTYSFLFTFSLLVYIFNWLFSYSLFITFSFFVYIFNFLFTFSTVCLHFHLFVHNISN